MAKSKKSRGPQRRKISLAAFFRKLWSKPELLARFSESPKGREEVLQQFKLSPKHKKLLIRGCMRDIIAELAGGPGPGENSFIINAADTVSCGHPECQAFMDAVEKR
jgi:hypothetical protein